MSRMSGARRAFRETIAPYAAVEARGGVTKLSISLPADLAETVREVAASSGLSVSAVIAASLRRTLDTADQERIDAAVEAQNEENLEAARAYAPVAAEVWSKLEW